MGGRSTLARMPVKLRENRGYDPRNHSGEYLEGNKFDVIYKRIANPAKNYANPTK